jgi:hypothetical protein
VALLPRQYSVLLRDVVGSCVTVTKAVSVQPYTLVSINEYTPAAVKPVIVVVGLVGEVIVAVPGLPEDAGDHLTPVPVPAMVAVPPGRSTHVTVWSGPAFGLVTVTVSVAEAEQVPSVYVTVNIEVTPVSVVIVGVVAPVLQR